ncbi:unnamed protein product [Clonostachys solani]|uniref:Uncharacterized protein n=1 Tax=Clonostachys solani TaxID=160281 RepID=A0A9N9ZHR0_9HYPO|nr:unnamed protein product [Clonostachys solani]
MAIPSEEMPHAIDEEDLGYWIALIRVVFKRQKAKRRDALTITSANVYSDIVKVLVGVGAQIQRVDFEMADAVGRAASQGHSATISASRPWNFD